MFSIHYITEDVVKSSDYGDVHKNLAEKTLTLHSFKRFAIIPSHPVT